MIISFRAITPKSKRYKRILSRLGEKLHGKLFRVNGKPFRVNGEVLRVHGKLFHIDFSSCGRSFLAIIGIFGWVLRHFFAISTALKHHWDNTHTTMGQYSCNCGTTLKQLWDRTLMQSKRNKKSTNNSQ